MRKQSEIDEMLNTAARLASDDKQANIVYSTLEWVLYEDEPDSRVTEWIPSEASDESQ